MDAGYLQRTVGTELAQACAAAACTRPDNAVEFLATWLLECALEPCGSTNGSALTQPAALLAAPSTAPLAGTVQGWTVRRRCAGQGSARRPRACRPVRLVCIHPT
jgi:hypothetical protein